MLTWWPACKWTAWMVVQCLRMLTLLYTCCTHAVFSSFGVRFTLCMHHYMPPSHWSQSHWCCLHGEKKKLVIIDHSVLLEPLFDGWRGKVALAVVRQSAGVMRDKENLYSLTNMPPSVFHFYIVEPRLYSILQTHNLFIYIFLPEMSTLYTLQLSLEVHPIQCI